MKRIFIKKIDQENNDKDITINENLQKILEKNLFMKEEFFSKNQNKQFS